MVAGEHNVEKDDETITQTIPAKKFTIHPKFNPDTMVSQYTSLGEGVRCPSGLVWEGLRRWVLLHLTFAGHGSLYEQW